MTINMIIKTEYELIMCYDCLVRHKSLNIENTNSTDGIEDSNQNDKNSLEDSSNEPSMYLL